MHLCRWAEPVHLSSGVSPFSRLPRSLNGLYICPPDVFRDDSRTFISESFPCPVLSHGIAEVLIELVICSFLVLQFLIVILSLLIDHKSCGSLKLRCNCK